MKETNVNKSNKKGFLYWSIVLLGTAFIIVASYNIGFKLGGMFEKENKTNNSEINIETKLGYWYEDKIHANYSNPNILNVKNYDSNGLLIDLYLSRTADFDDVIVDINGNKGSFTSGTDNGVSTNESEPKISGTIEILDDSIKLNITSSNVQGIPKGKSLTFSYQVLNSNIDMYKGIWYENESEITATNPTTINIKNVDGNKIVFDSYIRRTVDLKDITIYISNDIGKFTASIEDATTTDGKKGNITGYISLNNSTVELTIGTTNIVNLEAGTTYTFKTKKQ